MLNNEIAELDELIAEEKRKVAMEYFGEAWADAIAEGIEPEILADSAIRTALTALTRECGEDNVANYVTQLTERVTVGDYLSKRSVQ